MLLDTCTLLWLAGGHANLVASARAHPEAHDGPLHISAITAFEIAIRVKKGKLALPLKPERWLHEALAHHGISELAADSRILMLAVGLPDHHNDPADRIIVATAVEHNLRISHAGPVGSQIQGSACALVRSTGQCPPPIAPRPPSSWPRRPEGPRSPARWTHLVPLALLRRAGPGRGGGGGWKAPKLESARRPIRSRAR